MLRALDQKHIGTASAGGRRAGRLGKKEKGMHASESETLAEQKKIERSSLLTNTLFCVSGGNACSSDL